MMTSTVPFPLREPILREEGRKDYVPNLNLTLMCPDCKVRPPHIIEEFASGDLVCGDCGLVLGDRIIDTRSEWRTFANDEGDDPSRVGAAENPLLDGNQLDTIISRRDGGTGTARDLNKIHSRVSMKGERQLLHAFKDISAMCDSISLSKTVSDTAKQLYKRVEDEKLLRGKSNDAIIAACIFIACRQEQVGRTFREICALTHVPKKEIGRCYKHLQAKLQTQTAVMSSEDLMSRFCSNLKLPPVVQKAGMSLVRSAKTGTLAGKSPISIAAACIYLVSYLYRVPKSTREIAHVAGVSEATIKGAYKSLYAEKKVLMDMEKMNGEVTLEDLPLP